MLSHDFAAWKVPRLIKNPDLISQLEEIVNNHLDLIKIYFLDAISQSKHWPSVTWQGWRDFCDRSGIIDKMYVKFSDADRVFIASDFDKKGSENNQKKSLIRYEFIEGLIRMAKAKYQENSLVETLPEAFELLLSDMSQKYMPPQAWQEFRDFYLWTREVNDVFEVNLEGIRKLINTFKDPATKTFTQ